MLSCDDILAERSLRGREARVMGADTGRPRCDGPVRALWWSDAWIPFLKRNKEPVRVDLDPASAGTVGQVIEVDWEGRSNRVLAPSLEAYLGGVLRGLRAL